MEKIETPKVDELKTPEKPVVDLKVEGLKVKKRPKKLTKKVDSVVKIDLDKTKEIKENAIQESKTAEPMLQDAPKSVEEGKEAKVGLQEVGSSDGDVKEVTPIQEITKNEVKEEFVPTPVVEPVIVPDNLQDLVGFMKDTGGTVEDYVRLNADYSKTDPNILLQEYYAQTKPHLDKEEIKFLMEDKFHYDEEYDEERDIKKKQLAMKEEVAKANNFLDGLKDKYYREIKLKPGTSKEQQQATDFFNRHNKEQEIANKQHQTFKKSTKDFFTNDFKGFDFNVGEKKFRYGVKNADEVATAQSDIATFVKKFLSEDGSVKDYDGYHKAIYAARNADTIAQHFYEQGKSDAVKDVMAKSKNVSNTARQVATDDHVNFNGFRIKAVSGVDSSKLRIKRKK
ncbi:hypothetical protein H8D85_00665 [bacterium]|nr:hypothetical protein [bacterium]